MNAFKHHIAYYKNNPKGLWFKRKLYGWGWTPVKWQGWLVLVIWLAIFVALVLNLQSGNLLQNFLIIFASFAVLICICYAKGETPKWQWGPKNVK